MTSANQSIPRVGMLATVRNRRGVIASVEPFDAAAEGRLHLVRIEYSDLDGVPEDTVLWEREHNAKLLEPTALPNVSSSSPMDPVEFDALLRAVRWSAVTPFLNPDGSGSAFDLPLAAPFHGAVQTEDFQLVPLLKALRMPRVSLLLADDVGLGKTIEAGLILTELLIRRRIRRVLILCPASLRFQWQQEMHDKFSLTFDIVDRGETHALQKRMGLDANPWRVFPRIISSYHYLKQPDILEQFRSACRQPEGSALLPWDLLVVDEAHNLMPSNFGEDSDLAKMLRFISPFFEHKLFLTATPHNGHTRCFSGLLEQLDPVRFTQTSEFTAQERARVEDVVIRRLKREINEHDKKQSKPQRFPERFLEPLPLFFGRKEKNLSEAFQEFRSALKSAIASSKRAEQIAGAFAIEVLNKRLLSCPSTFADSWFRFKEGTAEAERAEPSEMSAAHSASEEDIDNDNEKLGRGRHACRTAGAWLKPFVERLSPQIAAVDDALTALNLMETDDGISTPSEDARWDRLLTLVKKNLRTGNKWVSDERLIVFTEYKTTLDYLESRLETEFKEKDRDSVIKVLYGGDDCDREAIKDAFNDPDDPVRILVATDAASEGQNLQETARLLIHYDIPWNPSRLEQRNGRLDRHSQARDVTVFHFTSEDDADLNFLAHVVSKVDTIREDLGSMGEVFDAAFQQRFSDFHETAHVKKRLDVSVEKSKGRASIPRKFDEALGDKEAERISLLYKFLDLTPESLKATLEVALGIGFGRPRLEGPDAKGRFKLLHPLPPQWKSVIDDSLRIEPGRKNAGAIPALCFSPKNFVQTISGRPVFRPAKDMVLLHLGHPVFRHALSVFSRARFPGSLESQHASRWTVTRASIPKGCDALILLSFEELAVNELREPFHHWVRTIQLPIKSGSLGDPLPFVPSTSQDSQSRKKNDERSIKKAADIWLEIAPDLPSLLEQVASNLTAQVEKLLAEVGKEARKESKERFQSRIKEVERAMGENTIQKLEKEREKALQDLRQMEIEPEIVREKEKRLRELEDELQRRKTHYQELLKQLQLEQVRIMDRVLSKRFSLRGKVQVFPLCVEIRLPEGGK